MSNTTSPRMMLMQCERHFVALSYRPDQFAAALVAVTKWKTAGLLTAEEYDCLGELVLKHAMSDGVLFKEAQTAKAALACGKLAECEQRLDAAEPQVGWCSWFLKMIGVK